MDGNGIKQMLEQTMPECVSRRHKPAMIECKKGFVITMMTKPFSYATGQGLIFVLQFMVEKDRCAASVSETRQQVMHKNDSFCALATAGCRKTKCS